MGASLLVPADYARLLERLHRLRPDSPRQWGTMTAPRMIAHLRDQMGHTLGDEPVTPRPGPLRWPIIKPLVMFWLPWPKGKIKGPPESFVTQPAEWSADLAHLEELLDRFVTDERTAPWPEHTFFGAMTKRRWARFICRHFDHHLRQFGV